MFTEDTTAARSGEAGTASMVVGGPCASKGGCEACTRALPVQARGTSRLSAGGEETP